MMGSHTRRALVSVQLVDATCKSSGGQRTCTLPTLSASTLPVHSPSQLKGLQGELV